MGLILVRIPRPSIQKDSQPRDLQELRLKQRQAIHQLYTESERAPLRSVLLVAEGYEKTNSPSQQDRRGPYEELRTTSKGIVCVSTFWEDENENENEKLETTGWCEVPGTDKEYFYPSWNDQNGPIHIHSIYNQ